MATLSVALKFIHAVGGVIYIGSLLFLFVVFQPVFERYREYRFVENFRMEIISRFLWLYHIGFVLLLLSGTGLAVLSGQSPLHGRFSILFSTKLALWFLQIFLTGDLLKPAQEDPTTIHPTTRNESLRIQIIFVLLFTIMILGFFLQCSKLTKPEFTFCADFNETDCTSVFQTNEAQFAVKTKLTNQTVRDYYNSVYFSGERLAFRISGVSANQLPVKSAHYTFPELPQHAFEIELIRTRENRIFGLVMLGSLIENRYSELKSKPFKSLPPFVVRYRIELSDGQIVEKEIAVMVK